MVSEVRSYRWSVTSRTCVSNRVYELSINKHKKRTYNYTFKNHFSPRGAQYVAHRNQIKSGQMYFVNQVTNSQIGIEYKYDMILARTRLGVRYKPEIKTVHISRGNRPKTGWKYFKGSVTSRLRFGQESGTNIA